MNSISCTTLRQLCQSRRGFTLVEMVIVVGVLAILVGISTPALFQMMLQKDVQEEEIALNEIRKAIEAHVADNNTLPTNGSDWSTALAGYTKLSQQQIANSVWNAPRTFRIFVADRQVQGVGVSISYVTVLSTGPDRTANAATNIPVTSGQFAAENNAGWWYRQADPVAAFGAVAPAGDDQIVTYTNYPEKMTQLQETLRRMNRIVTAMDALSKTRYSELVSQCATEARDADGNVTGTWASLCNGGMPERLIYMPRAQPPTGTDADTNYYDDPTAAPAVAPIAFNPSGNSATRKTQMQAIMRTLGLSDETCCSALTGEPFYYYSNPRQKTAAGGCVTTRPGPIDAKLPARLTTTPDPCG
jgi:prepilin-type N-terminal cleavage/methylation domain-containing protein